MRKLILVMVLLVVANAAAGFAADDKLGAGKTPALRTGDAAQVPGEKDIRATAEAFVSAFNKGDPKAVASLWTAQCEYVDSDGQVFRGREAIEKEYAAFFAKNPGVKMEVSVASIKMIADTAAIEDGTVIVKNPHGRLISGSHYTALHTKEGGTWLLASVREHRNPSPSIHASLTDLEWLIGQWSASKDSKAVDFGYRWIADKKFIELAYTVTDKESVVRSGIQIIGNDPASGELASWSFDSNGGRGRGQWRGFQSGWIIESFGVMSDGTRTLSADILSRTAGDELSLQSVSRRVDGHRLPDSQPLMLKRK
jgi:uncharacterized protein (TIGR02246 family)